VTGYSQRRHHREQRQPMELQHYARILNHHKMVLLLSTILAVAVVAFGSSRMVPIYTTSSLLRVAQRPSDVVSYSDLGYGQRLIETHVQVLKSRPFMEETSNRPRPGPAGR